MTRLRPSRPLLTASIAASILATSACGPDLATFETIEPPAAATAQAPVIVTGSGRHDLWVTGFGDSAHFDGSSWATIPFANCRAVAAGRAVCAPEGRLLAVTRDGAVVADFGRVQGPTPVATGGGAAFAAPLIGSFSASGEWTEKRVLLRYTLDAGFEPLATPEAGRDHIAPLAVHGPTELWAFGSAGSTSSLLHGDGARWNTVAQVPAFPMGMLTTRGAGRSWAVHWPRDDFGIRTRVFTVPPSDAALPDLGHEEDDPHGNRELVAVRARADGGLDVLTQRFYFTGLQIIGKSRQHTELVLRRWDGTRLSERRTIPLEDSCQSIAVATELDDRQLAVWQSGCGRFLLLGDDAFP